MLKTLLTLGTLLISCAAAPAFASSMSDIGSATYKLYDRNGDPFCSSIAIDTNLLLTANHCVQAGENIRIQTLDENLNVVSEQVLYVKAIRTLKGQDVAVLEVIDPSFKFETFVDIATNEEANSVTFGDEVIAIGYPATKEITVTEGLFGQTIKSPAPHLWEGFLYRFTAPIVGGSSGGGLYAKFGDEYKLIGVTVGGYNVSGAFMNIATPIESIEAVIKGFMTAKIIETIKAEDTAPGTGIDSK